jgi:hypothetical protein
MSNTDGIATFFVFLVPPYVVQHRNTHSYLQDMHSENDLYMKAGKLLSFLLAWESKHAALFERMEHLASDMALEGFWRDGDVELLRSWIADLKRVGYVPPPVDGRDMQMVRQQLHASKAQSPTQ